MAPMETLAGRPSISDTTLSCVRFQHPIEFRQYECYPKEGYHIEPFVFLDSNCEKSDGCKFVIDPGGATHVVQRLNTKSLYEIPVSGSGFLLRYTIDGDVETYSFSEGYIHSRSYQMEHSDTKAYVWIGNKNIHVQKPFEVVQLSTPKYESSDEKSLTTFIDKLSLPLKFWREYNSLIHEGKSVLGVIPLPI